MSDEIRKITDAITACPGCGCQPGMHMGGCPNLNLLTWESVMDWGPIKEFKPNSMITLPKGMNYIPSTQAKYFYSLRVEDGDKIIQECFGCQTFEELEIIAVQMADKPAKEIKSDTPEIR